MMDQQMLSHHNDRHHHHHGHGPDALNSTMDYSLSDYEQDHENENDDHHPHGNHDFPSTTMTGQSPPSTTASWATSSHSVTTNSTRTTTSRNQSIFRSVTPREEDNISRSSSRISKTASSRSSNKRKKKKRKKKQQRSYSSDQYRQLQQQQQQQELLLLAETKRRVLYGEQRSQLVLDEDTHVVWDVPPPKPWFLQIFEMKFCISMFCPPVVGGDGTTGETSIPPLQRSPSRSTSKSLSKMRFQRSKDNNTAKTKRSIPRMPLNHNQQHQHQQAQAQHYPNHAPNYHPSHPQQQQLPPQHDPRFSFPQPPSQMPMPMQQHPHAPPHFMYNTTPPPPHPHNHQHHHSNSSNLQNYPPSMYHYPPPPNNNIMRPPPNAHVHSTNKNTMKQRQQQQHQQHQQQMMFNFQVPPPPHGGVPLQQRVLSYNTCNTQAETSVATSNYNNFNNTNSSGGGGSTPQSYQRHGHKGHGHGAGEDSLHSLTPRSSSSSIVYDYQQYIPPTASMSSSSTMPAVPTTTLRTQPLGPSPPHRHTHHEPQEPSPPLALGVTVVGDNPTNNAAAAPTATTPSSLSSNLTTPSSLQAMQQQQDDLASITNGGSASVMSASAAGRPPLPLDTATGIAVVSATSPPVATSTPTSATGVGGGVGPVSTSSQQSLRRPNSLQRCFSESSQTSTGSRHRRMSAAGSFSQRSLEQILNFDNDDLDDDDDDEDLSTSVNTATQIQNQRHRQPQAQQQQQQNHTKNRNGGSSRRRRNGVGGDPVRRDSISKQLVEVNCNFNNGMFDDGYVSPLENDEYSFSNGKSNTPNVTTSAKGTDISTSPTKAMQQPQKQLGASKKKKHSQKENGDNHSMSPSKQTQIALHEQRRYSKKTSSSPETNHSSSSGSAGGSPTREAAKSTITLSQSSIGKSALPMVDTTVKDDDVGVVHEDGQDQEEEEDVYKYLPKCQLLEDEQTQVPSNDILISGWVAFSIGDIGFHKDTCTMNANKGVASAAATDTNDNDETAAEATATTTQDGIQPCDLAYLMISSSKSSLVFLQPQVKKKSMDDNNTNDKDDMVVQEVDLSRTMTVDTHLVSNRHGYAVVLKYQKYDLEQETFISQTICTILPVSLSNHFFEDSQHHQTLVSPRKFQKYQCSMFAPFVIWKNSNDDNDDDDDDKHHEKGKGQQGSGSSELEAATAASMLVKPSSSIRSVQRHPYHHSLSQPSQQNPGDFETEESSSLWIGQEYAPDAQTDAVTHIRFVLDTMVRECRT